MDKLLKIIETEPTECTCKFCGQKVFDRDFDKHLRDSHWGIWAVDHEEIWQAEADMREECAKIADEFEKACALGGDRAGEAVAWRIALKIRGKEEE